MKSSPPLSTAIGKIKYNRALREWCACLSYHEIIALVKDGWPLKDKTTFSFAQTQLQQGKCGSSWAYFLRPGNTKPLSGKNAPHNKR